MAVVAPPLAADESSSYRRILSAPDPDAVTWSYVCRFPEGHVFARGGRCRTSKIARSLIHRARIAARAEREEINHAAA